MTMSCFRLSSLPLSLCFLRSLLFHTQKGHKRRIMMNVSSWRETPRAEPCFSFYCFIALSAVFLKLFNVFWAHIAVQMFLGVVLPLALFIALCIIKDAYFSGSQKNIINAVIFFFSFGVFNILFGVRNRQRKSLLGKRTNLGAHFVCCFCLLFFCLGSLFGH